MIRIGQLQDDADLKGVISIHDILIQLGPVMTMTYTTISGSEHRSDFKLTTDTPYQQHFKNIF